MRAPMGLGSVCRMPLMMISRMVESVIEYARSEIVVHPRWERQSRMLSGMPMSAQSAEKRAGESIVRSAMAYNCKAGRTSETTAGEGEKAGRRPTSLLVGLRTEKRTRST